MTRKEIFNAVKNMCSTAWNADIVCYDDDYSDIHVYFTEDEQEISLRGDMNLAGWIRNFVEGLTEGKWTFKSNSKDSKMFEIWKI